MELLSSVWYSVRSSLTPGGRVKRRWEEMERKDSSTARGGSISLRGVAGEQNAREANGRMEGLVTPPETILPSAMVGMGNKKFKWTQHPPPRSTFGVKAGKRQEIPGCLLGSALRQEHDVDRSTAQGIAWRKDPGGIVELHAVDNSEDQATACPSSQFGAALGGRAQGINSDLLPSARSREQYQRNHQRQQHRKEDVSHEEFYGRFWGRMESIIREHEPSLANVMKPISLYNFHYDKALKLSNKANLLYSSDMAERRSNELREIENSISRIRTLRLHPKRRDVYPYKRTLPAPMFTDAEKAKLLELTRLPRDQPILQHAASKVKLLGRDLERLAPGVWLNDEIINLYMRLLQERDTRIHQRKDAAQFPKCHFFNTFFLSKLYKDSGTYEYNGVRRWTVPARLKATGQSRSSILEVDKVIVPVNQGNCHWTLAVIDLKNKRFEYFDSMGGKDDECLEFLARYLRDEFQNKRAEDRQDVLDWPRSYPENIPQQRNFVDCGVFLSMFANHLAVDAELVEMDMNVYRLVMLQAFKNMEARL